MSWTTRDQRRLIQEETLQIFDQQGYRNHKKEWVSLPETSIGKQISQTMVCTPEQIDRVYAKKEKYSKIPSSEKPVPVEILEGDTLEITKQMIDEGFNPVALNMANRFHPGGGYLGGASAQEESLCRRSSLPLVIDSPGMEKFYPFPKGGLFYHPQITVIRSPDHALLEKPYFTAMISAAAPCCRKKADYTKREGVWELNDHLTEEATRSIVSILKTGLIFGHDCIVLGAIGCGAFGNPPHQVARIFQEEIARYGFDRQYKKLVFAIFNDRNSPGEGNLETFERIFSSSEKK